MLCIVSMLDLLSVWYLPKQLGVAGIGSPISRPRRLGPAEAAETENEQEREYRENEGTGENVDSLKELKHGGLPGWN